MINIGMKIPQAEVYWHLTDQCNIGCDFCPTRYRANTNKRTTDEYLSVISKLQDSRYLHAESIKWKINGGEPLQFPNLTQLLKLMKSRPSYVRLDTSGGDSWFDLIGTQEYVDHYKVTSHKWQNESVLNFIIDFCKEHDKKLSIIVPLNPGQIFEDRAKVKALTDQGLKAKESILYNNNQHGDIWSGYSTVDINRIYNRPDDWVPEPVKYEPVYVDQTKPPIDDTPSYTGQGCYSGVDYIYISHKGFASGSNCGGRDIGNVFEEGWQAPAGPFPCCVNYCRSSDDRKKLRVGVKLG